MDEREGKLVRGRGEMGERNEMGEREKENGCERDG